MKIPVRDGRPGAELAPDGKGVVLGEINHTGFLEMGDRIDFPDGKPGIVREIKEILDNPPRQIIYLGNMPERRTD